MAENEKPEELEPIVIPGQSEKDNVFIFIVDRSGSMGGKKMEMTKEALKLFIQSLPPGCLYEIISFGSKYTVSSPDLKGFINNDQSLYLIKETIDGFTANMGGTEIYDPLNFAIKDFLSKSFVEKYMPKNIIT